MEFGLGGEYLLLPGPLGSGASGLRLGELRLGNLNFEQTVFAAGEFSDGIVGFEHRARREWVQLRDPVAWWAVHRYDTAFGLKPP